MDANYFRTTILAAKAVFLFGNDTLCLVDGQSRVYSFSKGDRGWHYDEKLQAMFSSPVLLPHLIPLSREQALEICLSWAAAEPDAKDLMNDAIVFAVQHHAGQLRKGTDQPYIFHPLETMLILRSMHADPALLIAGVLHDTVEDTSATLAEIREQFGEEVARLVAAHSEDKSRSWRERKQHTIDTLAHADRRMQMLVMADKVSNLRSMTADYAQVGDALWQRFNAGAAEQAWYYSGIQDALFEMQNDADGAAVYWEMVALFKDLFVHYFLDPQTPALYQVCLDGTAFRLEKGNPEWRESSPSLPTHAEPISRKDAEALEEQWNVPFWRFHETDIADAGYLLQESAKHRIELIIQAHCLTLLCRANHAQENAGSILFSYSLDEDATHRFLARLRIEYGMEAPLPMLLSEVFADGDIITCFTNFCQRNDIACKFLLA